MSSKNYTPDSIVQALHDLIDQRAMKGLETYGTTMDRDDLTDVQWLEHSIEEQLDNLLYSIKLLNRLKQKTEPCSRCVCKTEWQRKICRDETGRSFGI